MQFLNGMTSIEGVCKKFFERVRCAYLIGIRYTAGVCWQSRSMFRFLETKICFWKETKIQFHRIVGNGFSFPTYSKLPVYFRKLSEVRKKNCVPEAKSRSGSKIAIRKQNCSRSNCIKNCSLADYNFYSTTNRK